MDIRQWDVYASLYNKGIGKSGDKFHQGLIDPLIFDLLGDWNNLVILDAGCGNGYLANKLAPKAKRIIGVDSSRKLLQFAKNQTKTKNVEFKLANLTGKLPLKNNVFDVVIASMVCQYLPTLNKFSSESSRVLKNKGRLIMVISHPAHALFLRAQELLGKKNAKCLTSASYFKAGKRKKRSLWNKAILQFYHRPLMDYFNKFTPNFYLRQVVEKTEDSEIPRILGLYWLNSK